MVYQFECSLDKQDCATLYPGTQGRDLYRLPFTSQSCVRDNRLEGNVGRCGFPGAPCNVDSRGQDNCAGGYYTTSICQNGACRGEPGVTCNSFSQCNWGIRCNATFDVTFGVCGGYGAYMNNQESYDGLDFGRDYCLSGMAYQNDIGYWLCAGGPPMALTSPPLPSKVSTALVAGVSVAGAVVLAAIIAFIIWRTRRNKRSSKSPVAASVSNDHSSSIDEEKIRDSYVPHIQSTLSSKPDAVSESTQPDPPTGNPSFSNPMIVPSTPIFPPEIQSDNHPGDGNVPIRQTTMAPLERRAIMARQEPDAPSNVNSGFYSSAISGSLNAKSSPNQLYDTTRVPFNQGVSANVQSSYYNPYDMAKPPLKQGSEKDG